MSGRALRRPRRESRCQSGHPRTNLLLLLLMMRRLWLRPRLRPRLLLLLRLLLLRLLLSQRCRWGALGWCWGLHRRDVLQSPLLALLRHLPGWERRTLWAA